MLRSVDHTITSAVQYMYYVMLDYSTDCVLILLLYIKLIIWQWITAAAAAKGHTWLGPGSCTEILCWYFACCCHLIAGFQFGRLFGQML